MGRIELRGDGESATHVLDDLPLTDGCRVQVQLGDGSWLEGISSWSGATARWPGLRIELGGAIPQGSLRRLMAVMALPPQATVRRCEDAADRDANGSALAEGSTPEAGSAAAAPAAE